MAAAKFPIAAQSISLHDGMMADQQKTRVARINRRELSGLPSHWTSHDRGQYLRIIFQLKGIFPARLYKVEYYPHRHCWLITQLEEPTNVIPAAETIPKSWSDHLFYQQVAGELRRSALAATAAMAAHSPHLAQWGRKYQLPTNPGPISPAELAIQLGYSSDGDAFIHFNNEGGFKRGISKN